MFSLAEWHYHKARNWFVHCKKVMRIASHIKVESGPSSGADCKDEGLASSFIQVYLFSECNRSLLPTPTTSPPPRAGLNWATLLRPMRNWTGSRRRFAP